MKQILGWKLKSTKPELNLSHNQKTDVKLIIYLIGGGMNVVPSYSCWTSLYVTGMEAITGFKKQMMNMSYLKVYTAAEKFWFWWAGRSIIFCNQPVSNSR